MAEKEKPGELDEILTRRKELDDLIDTRFRRPIAVLFTDIVGSTRFFSTHGDIEGRLMIKRHNDLLTPLISQYQGNLIEIIGDALLASFDEPSGAVACAVKMQELLTQHNKGRAETDQIQIRIGHQSRSRFCRGRAGLRRCGQYCRSDQIDGRRGTDSGFRVGLLGASAGAGPSMHICR